jgi:hypothetical protein
MVDAAPLQAAVKVIQRLDNVQVIGRLRKSLLPHPCCEIAISLTTQGVILQKMNVHLGTLLATCPCSGTRMRIMSVMIGAIEQQIADVIEIL